MTREEVVKGLEEAIQNFERYSGDEYGREYDYARVGVDVLEGALTLLKAQEPVKPKRVNRYIDFDGEGKPFTPETYDCSSCGKELPLKAKHCPECGRAVKWE